MALPRPSVAVYGCAMAAIGPRGPGSVALVCGLVGLATILGACGHIPNMAVPRSIGYALTADASCQPQPPASAPPYTTPENPSVGITAITKRGVFSRVLLEQFASTLGSEYGACYAKTFSIVARTASSL